MKAMIISARLAAEGLLAELPAGGRFLDGRHG
jgi:hypothetical protein